MATTDLIHEAVKNSLIKDGWTITHDPYVIKEEIVKWTKPLNIAI